MNRYLLYRRSVALVAVFLVALAVMGCGKEGMPKPRKTQDTFTITGASASAMQKCIVARGAIEGARNNLETLTLEVAPITSVDDCPGCPFVAKEYSEQTPPEIQLDLGTGQFIVSYCPATPAPMYRWRLVGKNLYPALAHETTIPQLLILETP